MYEKLLELALPTLGVLLASIITLAGNAARKYLNSKIAQIQEQGIEREVIDALLEGISLAQDEFVREAKRSSADGKLTPEEIEKARNLAIQHASTILSGPAKDMFVKWTSTRLASVIRALVKGL
jgi:hypothetical protein